MLKVQDSLGKTVVILEDDDNSPKVKKCKKDCLCKKEELSDCDCEEEDEDASTKTANV